MRIFTICISILFVSSISAQSLVNLKRIENDTIYYDFANPMFAPVEMKVNAKENVKSYAKVKPYIIVQPSDTIKNVVVIPKSFVSDDTDINLKDYISISGYFGDPNTIKHNEDYLYTFPFPKGNRYRIMQGFNGKFSHRLKSSKYAIDFDIKIGDTISAARDGIVIFTKQDSKEHGPTRAFMGKANKIIIMHNDGTFAQYLHLDYNGVFVNEGDKIKVGQPIGLSGFTGFTTKPHLHFVIKKDKEISIPFYFKGYRNKTLKQKKKYGH